MKMVNRSRQWTKVCDIDRAVRYQQFLVRLNELKTNAEAVITRYTAHRGTHHKEALTQTAAIWRLELFQHVIETRQTEESLLIVSQLRGIPLQTYLQQHTLTEDTVCCWLLQILLFNYRIIEKFRNLKCNYLKRQKIYIYGNRLSILPPNIFEVFTNNRQPLKEFIDSLIQRDDLQTKACFTGPFRSFLKDVSLCNLISIEAVSEMIHNIKVRQSLASKSMSIPVMFVKNNRRYVRKGSINSKDSKPKSSAENGRLLMRKVSSSGKLPHYEISDWAVSDSPYKKKPLLQIKNSPIKLLLLNEKQEPVRGICKVNRVTFVRRKQLNFQSEKQIKEESPERGGGIKTERCSQDTLPFTKIAEPKSIERKLEKSKEQKPRRESKIERKLIIRNPFERKQLKEKFINIEESIIEKRMSSAWEDAQDINNMVMEMESRQLNFSSKESID